MNALARLLLGRKRDEPRLCAPFVPIIGRGYSERQLALYAAGLDISDWEPDVAARPGP